MRKAALVCIDCGSDKGGRHRMAQRCGSCRALFEAAMRRANVLVHRAIRAGRLQPARAFMCADCGAPATDWEHRDYRQPLAVEPTCRRCNFNRGPALYCDRAPTEPAKAA